MNCRQLHVKSKFSKALTCSYFKNKRCTGNMYEPVLAAFNIHVGEDSKGTRAQFPKGVALGVNVLPIFSKAVCECIREKDWQCRGVSGETTLRGSRRLHSALAAAPVLSAHARTHSFGKYWQNHQPSRHKTRAPHTCADGRRMIPATCSRTVTSSP